MADDKDQEIDEIWAKYDTDGSGFLEHAEAMNFLRDTFKDIFGTEETDDSL